MSRARRGCGRISAAIALACVIVFAAAPGMAQDDASGPSWLRAPRTRGPVAGTLALDDRRVWWGVDGALPLDLRPPANPRSPTLGLGLSVSGVSDARDLRYTALVDRRGRRAGEWLGVSTGGTASSLRLGTGWWRSLARFEVEGGIGMSVVGITERQTTNSGYWRPSSDSLLWRDTTTFSSIDHSVQRTTAQSALRWHYGRLEMSAVGGLTLGERSLPLRWAGLDLHLQATKNVLVMASLGRRPEASTNFDLSARPQMMLGLQVAPWASHDWAMSGSIAPRATDWAAKPVDAGRTVFRVRCRHASRVEVAGDFTEWAPVSLTAMGGDRWESTLTIAPGLHQVQIRIDGGAWQVPPGLPTTQREFAGAAGVLLVE